MAMSSTPPPSRVPVERRRRSFPVRRIYCVGRNYVEHAHGDGLHRPRAAVLLHEAGRRGARRSPRARSAACAYPSLTKNLHHEVELVVAIGTAGATSPRPTRCAHVWGYAVGLDMTRRDLQGEAKKQGRPWGIGKGFDQSAPIGPMHRAGSTASGADSAPI